MRKAVAIAKLAIERQLGALRSTLDQTPRDRRPLLNALVESHIALECRARAARIAVGSKPH